jgi:hypothetical protein
MISYVVQNAARISSERRFPIKINGMVEAQPKFKATTGQSSRKVQSNQNMKPNTLKMMGTMRSSVLLWLLSHYHFANVCILTYKPTISLHSYASTELHDSKELNKGFFNHFRLRFYTLRRLLLQEKDILTDGRSRTRAMAILNRIELVFFLV